MFYLKLLVEWPTEKLPIKVLGLMCLVIIILILLRFLWKDFKTIPGES